VRVLRAGKPQARLICSGDNLFVAESETVRGWGRATASTPRIPDNFLESWINLAYSPAVNFFPMGENG